MSTNQYLHGTGRSPNTMPPSGQLESKREQLSVMKRMKSVAVTKNEDEKVMVRTNYIEEAPATNILRVQGKTSTSDDKTKIKVIGDSDPNFELKHISEPFRKKEDDSKTTVILARHNYGSDYDEDGLFFDCEEITRLLESGPMSFRYLVIAGALFMVIANIYDYQQKSYYSYYGSGGISTSFFLISLYIWLFGAFIISLEIMPFKNGVTSIHRLILEQLGFLRFTWGRGFFYFFSGSLQFSLFTMWNMIAGGVMIAIGAAAIFIGRKASDKLKTLVRRIGNQNNLMEMFERHDRDRDGHLSITEFKAFVRDMNVRLSGDELTNAFIAIDRDNDRYITFQDLSNWYVDAKYNIKTDGCLV